jgi:PIN domain nuclease of toxin-antitoxin system
MVIVSARAPHFRQLCMTSSLISQAIAHGLAIVTPDPQVAQYPVRIVW